MPDSVESSIAIFQGVRGAGKTNAAKVVYNKTAPLFVVDIRKDWEHLPQHFFTYADFAHAVFNQTIFRKPMQVRFHFGKKEDLTTLFYAMCHFQNCTIIWDEADALFTQKEFEKPMIDVLLGSRNNNLNMAYMAKRPSLIPILVRSQADRYFVFRVEEEWDINYLSKRLRKNFPKDPFKLATGEAIVFQSGQEPVLQKFPKFTYSTTASLPESNTGKRKLITLKA